jgi:formamidopyrimidine-DNA glycosylase
MPELPEVETVRRCLAGVLPGTVVARVALARGRRDIVTGPARKPDLLQDCVIDRLDRRGKQLAIIGVPPPATAAPDRPADHEPAASRVLIVQLGMSGQLFHVLPGARLERTDHVHARWDLATPRGEPAGRLIFRDPRRFGGLRTFASHADLLAAWDAELGPDAPLVTASHLRDVLGASRRNIKAGLLDQAAVAGLGNIYVDESLWLARVAPTSLCLALTPRDWDALTSAIHRVLAGAIAARGSTLRDYRDGAGQRGGAQLLHQAYGRAGLPCPRCGVALVSAVLGQRTTVWCPACQPVRPATSA